VWAFSARSSEVKTAVAIEIERKYLVRDDTWREQADQGAAYRQGYLAVGPPMAIRVRLSGDTAILNLKHATTDCRREEFEYPIPRADGEAMIRDLCVGHVIEKTRYHVPFAGHTWEVDVFDGDNAGLVVAEIELDALNESFESPAWLGREVSSDHRYLNAYLAVHPYAEWKNTLETE
jgi:adenylate cyclase